MGLFTIEIINEEYPDYSNYIRLENKREVFVYFYEIMVDIVRDETIVIEHTNNFMINKMYMDNSRTYFLRRGHYYNESD